MNDYKDDLLRDLRSREYAAEYLSASIADSEEAFLIALRDVAEAQKGIAKLAIEAGVNRENLYRMLSDVGNPRLSSLESVLTALGFRLKVELVEPAAAALAPPVRAGFTPSALPLERRIKTGHNPFEPQRSSMLESLVASQYQQTTTKNTLEAYA